MSTFNSIRWWLTVTAATLMCLEPTAWAVSKNDEVVIRQVLEKLEITKREITLQEFYDKVGADFPPVAREALRVFANANPELRFPKVSVTKIPAKNGENDLQFSYANKTGSASFLLVARGNVMARMNGVTFNQGDFDSPETLFQKSQEILHQNSRMPASESPVVQQDLKLPLLDFNDFKKLSEKDKVSYIEKMRQLLAGIEAVQAKQALAKGKASGKRKPSSVDSKGESDQGSMDSSKIQQFLQLIENPAWGDQPTDPAQIKQVPAQGTGGTNDEIDPTKPNTETDTVNVYSNVDVSQNANRAVQLGGTCILAGNADADYGCSVALKDNKCSGGLVCGGQGSKFASVATHFQGAKVQCNPVLYGDGVFVNRTRDATGQCNKLAPPASAIVAAAKTKIDSIDAWNALKKGITDQFTAVRSWCADESSKSSRYVDQDPTCTALTSRVDNISKVSCAAMQKANSTIFKAGFTCPATDAAPANRVPAGPAPNGGAGGAIVEGHGTEHRPDAPGAVVQPAAPGSAAPGAVVQPAAPIAGCSQNQDGKLVVDGVPQDRTNQETVKTCNGKCASTKDGACQGYWPDSERHPFCRDGVRQMHADQTACKNYYRCDCTGTQAENPNVSDNGKVYSWGCVMKDSTAASATGSSSSSSPAKSWWSKFWDGVKKHWVAIVLAALMVGAVISFRHALNANTITTATPAPVTPVIGPYIPLPCGSNCTPTNGGSTK